MRTSCKDFDAVVVGSGPNGLAAAIRLQQAGLSVLLLEGKGTIGGGLRSAALTLPGFLHDVCSAVHPMAYGDVFNVGTCTETSVNKLADIITNYVKGVEVLTIPERDIDNIRRRSVGLKNTPFVALRRPMPVAKRRAR